MHQFFVPVTAIRGPGITITGEEAYHLAKVLRLTPGEKVAVADGNGRRFLAILEKVSSDVTTASLEQELPGGEPPVQVTLLQGIPKNDKFDLIIQKTTELGVSRIVPVEMKRCVVQIKRDKVADRVQRWQRIAREAAKQCGRSKIPEIVEPSSLETALAHLPGGTPIVAPWEEAAGVSLGDLLLKYSSTASVAYIVGPEGGLTAAEIDCARQYGAVPVTLGQRILRTETAAIAVLVMIMHRLGDLGGQACG